MRIEADAQPAGHDQLFDPPRRRPKVLGWIFGIDSAFDGRPVQLDVFLSKRQRFPAGDANLGFDQVDPGHHFGHGMFHLDPRVDLDEVKVSLGIHDKFHGPGIGIVGCLNQANGSGAHGLSGIVRQLRSGAFLDQFLVAALEGAIPFPEVDNISMVIGDNLDLDVPRSLHVFFQVDATVAEGRFRFDASLLDGLFEGQIIERHAHALASAAGGGFDQYGEADFMGDRQGGIFAVQQSIAAGDHRHLGLPRQVTGLVLVAQHFHRFGRGADEIDLATAADLVEMRVFGQEPVTRVDGLYISDFGRADHAINFQVAVTAAGGTDTIGFVGQFQVGSAPIGLAEDGYGFHAQFAAGANDSQRDLATVCYQDAFVHRSLDRSVDLE